MVLHVHVLLAFALWCGVKITETLWSFDQSVTGEPLWGETIRVKQPCMPIYGQTVSNMVYMSSHCSASTCSSGTWHVRVPTDAECLDKESVPPVLQSYPILPCYGQSHWLRLPTYCTKLNVVCSSVIKLSNCLEYELIQWWSFVCHLPPLTVYQYNHWARVSECDTHVQRQVLSVHVLSMSWPV